MVNPVTLNGTTALPACVRLSSTAAGRIPSPGTQRVLKAQTGRSWDSLVGPDADSADRFQTLIWCHLRHEFPDLEWADCADIEVDADVEAATVDPTRLSGSAISPLSAGSGD